MDELSNDIEVIVDCLLPELDAYEMALYLLLYRKTIMMEENTIRIGKRSLSANFVRGTRGGGKQNQGGLYVNYQHISRVLSSLEKKRCISVLDTTRDGTLYVLSKPLDIPIVKEKQLISNKDRSKPEDYFTDPSKRKEIFERDDWRCKYCGEKLTSESATIDHFIPQSKGGKNDKENLRTSCLICNSIKGGRDYDEVATLLNKSIVSRRSRETVN